MPAAYFGFSTIGTGKEGDAYRPDIASEDGIEAWAACYEVPAEKRGIVLVSAGQAVLDALAAKYERLYAESEVRLAV